MDNDFNPVHRSQKSSVLSKSISTAFKARDDRFGNEFVGFQHG